MGEMRQVNRNIAFIHASLAVANQYDRPSLIAEEVGGCPLLMRLVRTMRGCRNLDEIVVVTSDQPCDEALAVMLNGECADTSKPAVCIHKIPSTSPFAFNDENMRLAKEMLFRDPCYGLFSAEGFLSLTEGRGLNLAVVIDANASPFATADFVDEMIERAGRSGEAALLRNPTRGIAVTTRECVERTLSKYGSAQRGRQAAQRKEAAQEVENLRNGGGPRDDQAIESIARRKFAGIPEGQLSPLLGCFAMRDAEEGRGEISQGLSGEENCLFAVMRESDLATARRICSVADCDSFDSLNRMRVELEKESRERFPSYLNIEITNKCNAHCSFCPNTFLTRTRKDMEWELFRKIIDEAADRSLFVALSGFGEPTLHPGLLRFAEYAKKRGVMRLAVETNGQELDGATVRELFAKGLDFLILNMNAMASNVSDWETRVEDILAIRDEFRSAGNRPFPRVILQVVNSNAAAATLDRVYDRFHYLVDRIVITPFDTFRGRIPYDGVIDFTPMNRMPCRRLIDTLFVLSDGTIGLCGEFFDGVFPEFSVNAMSIGEISSEDRIWQMYAKHYIGKYPGDCANCSQWYLRDFGSEAMTAKGSMIRSTSDSKYAELMAELSTEIEECVSTGDLPKAVDKAEEILRYDPANRRVMAALSSLARHLSADQGTN
jgi:organic radical activating enzyme